MLDCAISPRISWQMAISSFISRKCYGSDDSFSDFWSYSRHYIAYILTQPQSSFSEAKTLWWCSGLCSMCLPDILSDIMSLYARRLSLQLIVVCSIINGENFVLVFWKYWTLFLNSKHNYSLTSLQKLFLKSFCNFLDTLRRICCSFSYTFWNFFVCFWTCTFWTLIPCETARNNVVTNK